jgi:hypothetical protein
MISIINLSELSSQKRKTGAISHQLSAISYQPSAFSFKYKIDCTTARLQDNILLTADR